MRAKEIVSRCYAGSVIAREVASYSGLCEWMCELAAHRDKLYYENKHYLRELKYVNKKETRGMRRSNTFISAGERVDT